jgi:two-component system, sensor histidine kinase ChiS
MTKKILIVEDEPDVARLIQMVVSVAGYETRSVATGFAAIEEIEKNKPHLILLDILMPGMNGYEVCEEVRKKYDHRSIKIVFLTGLGFRGDAQKGIALGADDYVIKPFDPQILLDKVNKLLLHLH